MQKIKTSKYTRYFQKLKLKGTSQWALSLFLCIITAIVIIFNFHSSIDKKYDHGDARTFSVPNENNFTFTSNANAKSFLKDATHMANTRDNDIGLLGQSGNINDRSMNNRIDKDKLKEHKKIDFVLNEDHKLKKNIDTNGKTTTTIVGYSKPIDLGKYSLPSLQEVEDLYGDKVVIHGLDQCKVYRDKVPGKLRFIVPAGLQNTGTNLLYKLLQRNCYIPERWAESPKSNYSQSQTPFTSEMEDTYDCFARACKTRLDDFDLDIGMRANAHWWKHAPLSWRDNPPYPISRIHGKTYDRMNALPIVMIKDPINWMSSMCRNPYEVSIIRPSGKCPKLVPKNRVVISPSHGKIRRFSYSYDSLVDMFSDYYNEWISNASFPSLIVRYEDLLFHPKVVIKQVCSCAGGKMRDDGSFSLVENSAKRHGSGIFKRKPLEDESTTSERGRFHKMLKMGVSSMETVKNTLGKNREKYHHSRERHSIESKSSGKSPGTGLR